MRCATLERRWILKNMTRISKTGLLLVLLYGICAALLFWMAADGDDKGKYVLKQLAVMPAVMLVGMFDTKKIFDVAPFIATHWFSFLLSVMIVYCIGHMLGVVWKMLFVSPKAPEK